MSPLLKEQAGWEDLSHDDSSLKQAGDKEHESAQCRRRAAKTGNSSSQFIEAFPEVPCKVSFGIHRRCIARELAATWPTESLSAPVGVQKLVMMGYFQIPHVNRIQQFSITHVASFRQSVSLELQSLGSCAALEPYNNQNNSISKVQLSAMRSHYKLPFMHAAWSNAVTVKLGSLAYKDECERQFTLLVMRAL